VSFDPASTRRLGLRDVAVSQLGVGTAPFGSFAREDTDAAIGEAFAQMHSAGLRYFDTAPFYGLGLAEHRLGACLRTIDRRSLTLSTKVGRMMKPVDGGVASGVSGGASPFEVAFDYSYDGTLRSIEHTLQRLQTNAVDIVLIHDVNRRWQGDRLEERYREAMSGAHRALYDLRAQGTIKAFGVGVNDWHILLRFAADGDFDCFMLAGRYTLLDHSALESFMPDCERRGISVAVYPQLEFAPAHGAEKGLSEAGQTIVLPLLVAREFHAFTFVFNGELEKPLHDPSRELASGFGFAFGRSFTRKVAAMIELRTESSIDFQRDRLVLVNAGIIDGVRNVVVYANIGHSVFSDDGGHFYAGGGFKVVIGR
jgi:aryl-alcohol dehydrogenase-like predicted oxidoreductase